MTTEYLTSDLKEPLLLRGIDLKERHVFKLVTNDIKTLFNHENTYRVEKKYLPDLKISRSLHKLNDMGGLDFFFSALQASPTTGINGDQKDIVRRKYFFGSNERPPPEIRNFWEHVKENATTGLMKLLFYTATLAVIIGWLSELDGNGLSITEW